MSTGYVKESEGGVVIQAMTSAIGVAVVGGVFVCVVCVTSPDGRNDQGTAEPIRRFLSRIGLVCPLVLLLAGCFIAKDGPTAFDVRANSEVTLETAASPLSYALVKISPQVLNGMSAYERTKAHGFAAAARRRGKYTDVRLARGDMLGISIFEASAGGLFIPQEAGSRAGNFVTIPNQQVDGQGNITVPYAGTINVLGRTAPEVSRIITGRLEQRAIEPQVVVSVVERRGSNDINVLGEVNSPLRFSLDPGGINLLGAIARAGGPKQPAYETVVTLQRGQQTYQATMSTIVKSPDQNIPLVPGDMVYVSREPKIFMVFGATPTISNTLVNFSRKHAFDDDNLTVADGLARANGLDSLRADSSAIFLLRFEERALLAHLGVDVSKYAEPRVPTVYQLNFSRADGLFLANSLYLKHRDIIYVSDAPSRDLLKIIEVARQLTQTVLDVSETANSILDIRRPR